MAAQKFFLRLRLITFLTGSLLSICNCYSHGWIKDITDLGFVGLPPQVIPTSDGGYFLFGTNWNSALVAKTDSMGDTLWTKSFPGGTTLAHQTADGGFILGGITRLSANGNVAWQHNLGLESAQTVDGGYVVVGINSGVTITRIDQNGSTLWTKTIQNTSSVRYQANTVIVLSDGYLIGGLKMPNASTVNLSDIRALLIKTDFNGDTLWTSDLGSSFWGGEIHCIQPSLDGGFFVGGNVENGFAVVKTDATGHFNWGYLIDCDWSYLFGYYFSATSDSGLVVVGDTNKTIRKFLPNGNTIEWEKAFGIIGRSIHETPDNGFIVTAIERSTGGDTTYYLIKTDNNGDFSQSTQSVQCDSFCVTSIAMDTSGSSLNITVFLEGDSSLFINYPYVSAVTDAGGDTVAAGTLNSYGQFGSTTITYAAATSLASVPANFTATVYFQYDTTFCGLPYPCPSAACAFTPTVSGDLMLCPDEQGLLTTQVYDSYQWYRRMIGETAQQPVAGATSQTLAIDQYSDAGYYFSVEVTDTGCTEWSSEVLVDGYVFLLPEVETTGDYTVGVNGETIICEGDTAYFTLRLPYDTLITWYKNGSPLAGVTGNVLTITDSGFYSVEGAPSICPNFIQQLGLTLEVQVVNCTTGVSIPRANAPDCYWNDLENTLYVKNIPAGVNMVVATLYTMEGKMLMQETTASENASAQINFRALSSGTYICKIRFDNGKTEITRKLAVMK